MRYTEKQQFPDWLRYGVLIFVAVFTFLLTKSNTVHQPLMTILLAALLAPAIIFFWTLETEIDNQHIYIKISPIISKKISFNDVQTWEIRTYRPILEYGGWGIRFGRKGTAYNVKGNQGLQLTLNSGKRILIGTQRQDDLKRILRSSIPNKESVHIEN